MPGPDERGDETRGEAAERRDQVPEAQRGRLGRLFAALVNNEGEDAEPEGDAGAPPGETSSLDLEALSRSLVGSPDPMGALRGVVADMRARSEAPADGEPGRTAPSGFELYLAMRLGEAGLLERDVAMPTVSVVRPRTSDLFYLRVMEESLPWLAKVKVLRVEAALNCALLVGRALDDPNAASLEELVRCEQRVCRSIVSQAPRAAARLGSEARGEWAVRSALSAGIEALQLPHRLTARFRTNVRSGVAAIEVDLVPPRAWASSAYVDGLGIVAATSEMRRRAASDYNLRLAVLLAAYALAVAPQLSQVWVAGVVDGPAGHACYYSARLDRDLVEGVDPDAPVDPWAVMAAAGATIEECDRTLRAVRQGFSLDEERFCPARRYDAVELSDRELSGAQAAALGCDRADGLGIDEAARRRALQGELCRQVGDSTAQSVRALLAHAGDDEPRDVRSAALRCVRALIDGTLEDDPLAVTEEFVGGGELARGADRARELLARQDFAGAERAALEALEPLEREGALRDEGDVAWRSFATYADRALYNRLVAPAHERCLLAPSPCLEALLVASAAALAQDRTDDALERARRAARLAPMSVQASLHLAQCLEAADDARGACEELCRALSVAHDQESVGLAYLMMSQLQWRDGHVLAAQACYQRACRNLPTPALVAGIAVVALLGQVGEATGAALTEDAAESALRGAQIPLSPTPETGEALLEATRAAVDAELFAPARDLLRSLCSVFRDDVLFGVLRSIEAEPDR